MGKFIGPIIDIKRYGGKQVAIVGNRIVASGRSTSSVLQKAKKRISKKDHDRIALLIVPRSLPVVYRL